MSDNIPFALQVEIIKKLPVKSVIQFRSVSKPWKSVIDSSDFIADYTLHSHAQPQHLLIRYNYEDLSSEGTYFSIVDDDAFPQNMFSLTVPPSISLLQDLTIGGSSRGLLCLFGYYSRKAMAVLWNPSIRRTVAIAVPDADWPTGGTFFGFGVCPATSDPKIVKITDTRRKIEGVTCSSRWKVDVFSLSSGVWRSSISNLSDNLDYFQWPYSQVTIDEFVYWLGIRITNGSRFYLLVSFDLSSEEFREICFPNELAFPDPVEFYLYKRIDSLVVLKWRVMNNKNIYEVWMMDNGHSKLFSNLFTMTIPDVSSVPLEFRRNGDIIMGKGASLLVYELLSEKINVFGYIGLCYPSSVRLYTESLILLDQKDTLVDEQDDE